MGLTLDRLSLWLPGRGTVLSSISADLEGVTLVVGRSGAGATTLLRAVTGELEPGARTAGSILLNGTDLQRCTADEIAGLEVAVFDQPLAALRPAERPAVIESIRSLADSGVVVLWAEHLVEEAVAAADRVVEIVSPTRVEVARTVEWNPRTVPAPPQVALARSLGLPRESWTDEVVLGREVSGVYAGGDTPRHRAGDPLTTAAPELVRLDRPVELYDGECLGIVSVTGDRARELDVARRLVAVARGERTLAPVLTMPRSVPVGRLVSSWERARGVPTGSVDSRVAGLAVLAPTRPLRRHSTGEAAALAWGFATAAAGPRLLVDPTRGLDPAGRRHLAAILHDDPRAAAVLVSNDPELVSRACHRILLVSQEEIVADGAPLAIMDLLPARPVLARLGARALRVADLAPAGRVAR